MIRVFPTLKSSLFNQVIVDCDDMAKTNTKHNVEERDDDQKEILIDVHESSKKV
jgi:hypothetical protein